ncbi:hypothetical protein LCGC14_2772350, partial [marine sediment metagenome]
CRTCGHKLRELAKEEEKTISKSPLNATSKRLTYLSGDEAYEVLKANVFAITAENLTKWTYTAFPDKVYVRGSDGFMLWIKTAPNDLRKIVILEVD